MVLIQLQPQARADDSNLHKFTKKWKAFMDKKSILCY